MDKGKKVMEDPKRVIPDLASFLQTPVHNQHEVITKGTRAELGKHRTAKSELLVHITLTPPSHK
ncbi:Hypothetical predicted protein, partial [Prunus dulcis]